ncbi:MAG: methyltransferase domain-containing protein [Firmicutes bacterium]|nr:methyltransferase domain-containing protein [Bacillota bacterium]
MNDWTRKKTEEALRSDDWQAHMTFSPLRESLFNWYEFLPDGHLLELNAGRGALTGLFCDRCRSVTALTGAENEEDLRRRYDDRENLTIRTGSWNDWEEGFSGAFDYVVVTGLLEKEADPADALHSWVRFLKEDGRLLLTVENRFGLKYFCGAADPFTGIPFDGPNGYFRGVTGESA